MASRGVARESALVVSFEFRVLVEVVSPSRTEDFVDFFIRN